MGMSDCVKCWDTPCRCGHDYAHWSDKDIEDQIKMFEKLLAGRKLAAETPEPGMAIPTDVSVHPSSEVRFHLQRMIWERDHDCMVLLHKTKLVDSGLVQDIDGTGEFRLVALNNGNRYQMTTECFKNLGAAVGDNVSVFTRNQMFYIQLPGRAVPRPAKTESIHKL